MRKRRLRKIAQRARREFEAGKAVLPRGNLINRPVVTGLWVNGRASEDRDEWTEEVGVHCESFFDDKEETSEVQAERILSQRRREIGKQVLCFVFLTKPEKGLRRFRAIALLSVFSKWYATVLVDMLHEEKEPSEWKRLHVGAERGVNCEHMQALVTNIFQRH